MAQPVVQLGVVSDTHGQVAFAREAVRLLESLDVQAVLHCGDIGSPEIVRLFGRWPTHFVLGNVDYPAAPFKQAIAAAGQHDHDRFGELTLADRTIALLHSDDDAKFREVISSGRYDLICYGHTHRADRQRHGKTVVLNPGALYRATPHTMAIVDLATLEVQTIRV